MRTLSQVLSETAAAFPEREAIIDRKDKTLYSELDEKVSQLARGLIELGVRKGDKVGLWMPNIPEWVVVYYAVARIGGVVVPMNTRYKSHEARYILKDCEATTLFIVDQFLGIDYREMIRELRDNLPALKRVIVSGEAQEAMHTFEEVSSLGQENIDDGKLKKRTSVCDPHDNVFILYTSGTTGNPKGAMLSHNNIAENARQVTEVLHTTENDTFLLAVPFFHCFGCVMGIMGAVTWGASIVPMNVFKAKEALELVEKHGVSVLYGVPTMFVLELEAYRNGKDGGSGYDVSSLRTGIMAGAPCPIEVMRGTMEELGCNVSIAYGLTEASPVITMTRFDDPIERRVETVGKPLPNIEVRIVDDDRWALPPSDMGELACRGYNVMLGYYKMPEKTAEVIDEEGWLYSGDLATQDEEGYVKIVGRKKDMIITGGFNVYPAEIEEYLFTHPDVQNVSVVGVSDEVMGEVAIAYIIPKTGANIDSQGIVDFCSGEIANFKVPRYVQIVDSLPMTQSGKIKKFLLRKNAAADQEEGRLEKLAPIKKR